MVKRLHYCFLLVAALLINKVTFAQHPSIHHHSDKAPENVITGVDPQPLTAQANRLKNALSFLGSALPRRESEALDNLHNKALTSTTSQQIQAILDPYCLAQIDINPETRVKVTRGQSQAKLIQGGWSTFLVKVHNEAGVTAQLKVESDNAKPLFHRSPVPFPQHALKEHALTQAQIANRFLEVRLYQNQPLQSRLSGLALEYCVLQIYCKDAGQREADLAFNIGQGTQDLGFRHSIAVLFTARPAVKVVMHVKDFDDSPTMASFVITDGVERVIAESVKDIRTASLDYRLTLAQIDNVTGWPEGTSRKVPSNLTGIYPLPSRRLASSDEYPDFYFEPQIYRKDGEHVFLAPGNYKVTYTKGPEYLPQTQDLQVPAGGITSMEATFKLIRWINLPQLGWYSADHHIHAAGCSHYESPEEGVRPLDMWRQIAGEDLNIGAVLAWAPGWYHQKVFFTGKTSPLSTNQTIMRYDVEVSGFPSSHAGHLVLLNLKEDNYPGTKTIEEWPSWTLPVLKWAKAQGGVTGYAHSGNGLEPLTEASEYDPAEGMRNFKLLNYTIPKMDGIGANEYITTVTTGLVDFYSLGDTPAPWELNMWYHTLNCGFNTKISGETDFPCIYDKRVGMARTYFKPGGALSFSSFLHAVKDGKAYVSEGGSHIIDFSINALGVETPKSEINLSKPTPVKIQARVAAWLPETPDDEAVAIATRTLDQEPYWSIERARIRTSRKIKVELIVNGQAADSSTIIADGSWQPVKFNYSIKHSSWLALRVFPSSHTNPIWVLMNGKPVNIKKSATWCRQALEQCWKMKQANIRPAERPAAAQSYDQARKVYAKIIAESVAD